MKLDLNLSFQGCEEDGSEEDGGEEDGKDVVLFDVVAVGAVLILCLEGGEDGKDGDVLVTVNDCDDCT